MPIWGLADSDELEQLHGLALYPAPLTCSRQFSQALGE
jgi:hypothetical protein